MSMNDTVADLLTRIRNGQSANKSDIVAPSSKLKVNIVKVLEKEGYVKGYSVTEDKKPELTVELKYYAGKPVISKITRVSKPGLRVYVNKNEIPRVLGGLGIAIISTSKGLMTDLSARELGLGGEVLCYVE